MVTRSTVGTAQMHAGDRPAPSFRTQRESVPVASAIGAVHGVSHLFRAVAVRVKQSAGRSQMLRL